MEKPSDEAPPDVAEDTVDDVEIMRAMERERRAQQHEYFRKRDVWPRR